MKSRKLFKEYIDLYNYNYASLVMSAFKNSSFYKEFIERTERKDCTSELMAYITNTKLYNFDLYRYIISMFEYQTYLRFI
jgi:hypothetical protein